MKLKPNPLCLKMVDIYKSKTKDGGKVIICNEGGSRSGKTWSAFYFIYLLCDANRDVNLDIYILRDTLVNCRDKTLLDFQHFLEGMGEWKEKNLVAFPKPVYNLFGQKIRFRGLDDEDSTEGYPSDIVFVNEALDCSASSIKALRLRNKKIMILDWNPKYTFHELFQYEKRPDTVFTKSTYLDNKENLPLGVIQEIEGFNPSNPANIESGTADMFRWKVYGCGERANKDGLVFPEVTWIDKFPEDLDDIGYGMDFGRTAQTTLVKVARRFNPIKSDLYVEGLFYKPTPAPDMVQEMIFLKDLSEVEIDCDSNESGWISHMRSHHFYNGNDLPICKLRPTAKYNGSRNDWISAIKRFNIYIVHNVDFRIEQENFCYDEDSLSHETVKKFDHYWSATGYAVVRRFKHRA